MIFFFGLLGTIALIPISIVIKIINVCNKDYAPIFYTQQRIGKNGKEFKLYKYRSMVPNADEILEQTLEMDKVLAEEYKINKKLKNDPRITKYIGKNVKEIEYDTYTSIFNDFKKLYFA